MGQGRVYACPIACLLLYEDYVWVSLGNAMKAKQSKVPSLSFAYETAGPLGLGANLRASYYVQTAAKDSDSLQIVLYCKGTGNA